MLKYLLVLGLCLTLAATEDIHYLEIGVEPQGHELVLTASPQVLFSHRQVRDNRYFLGTGIYNAVLDAPFRQSVFFLRNAERNRASIFKRRRTMLSSVLNLS